jgi:cytoskeletal protein CcmA (bactofilin family)
MANGSVIGPGTVVRGNVRGEGPLHVHGRIEGDVTIAGDVVLGEAAALRGNLTGMRVTVRGRVLGNLKGSEAVLLEAGARVAGDVVAPCIGIAPGALVRGDLRTEEALAAPLPRHPNLESDHCAPERPKPAAESPRQASERPKPAAESPRQASERPKLAAEPPKAAIERPAVSANAPAQGAIQQRAPEVDRRQSLRSRVPSGRPRQPPPPVVPVLRKGAQASRKKSGTP